MYVCIFRYKSSACYGDRQKSKCVCHVPLLLSYSWRLRRSWIWLAAHSLPKLTFPLWPRPPAQLNPEVKHNSIVFKAPTYWENAGRCRCQLHVSTAAQDRDTSTHCSFQQLLTNRIIMTVKYQQFVSHTSTSCFYFHALLVTVRFVLLIVL